MIHTRNMTCASTVATYTSEGGRGLGTRSGTGPPRGAKGSKGRNWLDCIRGKGGRGVTARSLEEGAGGGDEPESVAGCYCCRLPLSLYSSNLPTVAVTPPPLPSCRLLLYILVQVMFRVWIKPDPFEGGGGLPRARSRRGRAEVMSRRRVDTTLLSS